MTTLCHRNMKECWYQNRTGRTAELDANGNRTGDYVETYSTPIKFWATLSMPTGYVSTREFQIQNDSDTKVYVPTQLPIKDDTLLWIDYQLDPNENPLPKPTHVVDEIRPSIRGMCIIVKEVDRT